MSRVSFAPHDIKSSVHGCCTCNCQKDTSGWSFFGRDETSNLVHQYCDFCVIVDFTYIKGFWKGNPPPPPPPPVYCGRQFL